MSSQTIMSPSPLTPNKVTMETSLSSSERLASSVKSRFSSVNEPSPASTYGDTVSSSVPVTPLDRDSCDMAAGITQSMRAAQLDPAIESISGSPLSVKESKHHSTVAHQLGHVTFGEDFISPSKAMSATNVKRVPSTNTSPSSGRSQAIRSAPTWRGVHDGSFVQSTQDRSDDPFVSKEEAEHEGSSPSTTLAYNPGRIGVTPTNNTAQAIYSPQACVFVANLSQSETDEQLEYAVAEAFQQFGNVYVKIRRDVRQMPFAFAQYTNIEDAQRAITLGRGMLINGRQCRTEVARVNRSLYLSRINGGPISESEARDVMSTHGLVEHFWFASQTEREMFGLPEGVFVRFAFFDDCRDAQVNFRDSVTHRLEQVKGLDEVRGGPGHIRQSFVSPYRRESYGRLITPPSVKRNADARSIFIGNIPHHVSEDQLVTMFQVYGRIVNVEIIRKPSMSHTSGVNAFAFVEYEHPQSVSPAVQASPRRMQGLHLRVERKEPSNTNSRSPYQATGSPRRNALVDSQELLVAFQRGVTMGMSQVSQQQMMPPPMYPYYAGFDPSLQQTSAANPGNTDTALTNTQPFGAGYVAPAAAGQIPYTNAPAQYGQYSQPQQHYAVPNPVISQYQWPPVSTYDGHAALNANNAQEGH